MSSGNSTAMLRSGWWQVIVSSPSDWFVAFRKNTPDLPLPSNGLILRKRCYTIRLPSVVDATPLSNADNNMKATLSLTHDCNLACKYCYAGRKHKSDMSLPTAQKAVDFTLGLASARRRVSFSFFGGEPLLCFDLMVEIVRYIRSRQQDLARPVSLSMTTNGTLLTEPVLEFLARENVDVCISIDGTAAVHDRNRVYRDGRGTLADVARNLSVALAELTSVQVNAVYGPDTLDDLAETVSFLADFGAPVIHLNPNISAAWDAESRARLAEAYMQVAQCYIESYQHGRELAVNLIDSKIILFLKGGYASEDMCGMGESQWGFAPSGNIYPCERLIGEDDDPALCLGNVHNGVDPRRRCAVLARRGNRNVGCKSCEWVKYCMNWCGCTNHAMTGATDLAGPMLCASERAALRAAKHVLTTLSVQENDLFVDHLMRYLQDGRHHLSTR